MQNEAGTPEAAGEPARTRHDGDVADRARGGLGVAALQAAHAAGGADLAPDAYEAVFRASPVALAWACDPHCAVVLRNPAMNRILPPLLDWRAWRLPDGSAPALFEHGVPLALDRQPLRRAALEGEATTGREIELRWPGRAAVFLSVSAAPLRDATGAPCGAVASAVDITAERQAAPARDRTSSADVTGRAKDELLGRMGHELRNPLNAIVTAVEVLNRAPPAAPEAHSARRIVLRQTRRLAELINELSEVGRALADRTELLFEPVDFNALVEQRVGLAAPRAAAKRQRLRAAATAVRIEADRRPLADAVDRLLDEAMRSAAEGGVIVVQLRRAARADGDEAVLEIGAADALFPGASVEVTGAVAPGVEAPERGSGGLGFSLTLVRHVVEQHGGRLAARRHSGAGGASTVFTLCLPALADPAVVAPRTAARVGVIDDRPDALSGLCALLERGGHAVTTAHGGPGAVGMLLRDAPEIAIIGIGLPGFDGFEVARRSRAAGFQGRLFAVSGQGQVHGSGDSDLGNPSPATQTAAFEAYLMEPIDSRRLAELIASPAGPPLDTRPATGTDGDAL